MIFVDKKNKQNSLNFLYSEKATKNIVGFSEYMTFTAKKIRLKLIRS